MRMKFLMPAVVSLVMAIPVFAQIRPMPSDPIQYWPELFPRRVGVVHAIHDYWHTPNITAANDLGGLGIRAIKLWPREHYLTLAMQQIYRDPRFDVIVLRPLQNSAILHETGCDGSQHQYWRWENIDYGQVARDLYTHVGDVDKVIILTGWENDHQIKGLGCGQRIPSQAEINSFKAMLEAREAGVQAAWNDFPSANLRIYHAVEVNHVFSSGFRVIDHIVPFMSPKPTLISYSHWSATRTITETVNRIASVIGRPKHYVFVGEIGRRERPCCSQYPYLFNSYSEAYNTGANLVLMWTYLDAFNCPKTEGTWLRRCDGTLATSYNALIDLKAIYE